MAISSFATPTTGFTPLYVKFTGVAIQGSSVEIPIGYYEFTWFPDDLSAATALGTFRATNSAGASTVYTTVDNNSADTKNKSVAYINVTVPIVFIEAQSQTGNLIINRLSDTPKTSLTGTATVYSSSQNVTLTAASNPCLLIGGGGGGSGSVANSMGGNGGGGGYFQSFAVAAGTYALVCGAAGVGGAGQNWDGGAGGASTFAGYSVNGGNGARGGGYGSQATAGGANGGGYGSSGATPTGFPYWKTPGSGGQGYTGSGGGGGGIGNGGAGSPTSNVTGGTGGIGGGGGGGCNYSSTNFSGGPGGPGGLAVLVWS